MTTMHAFEMPLARSLAAFVVGLNDNDLTSAIRAKLDACLINGYGIALGGRSTPYYKVAGRAEACTGSKGPATLLFNGDKVSTASATFVNAALFHGRAQDDTCGRVHIGAIVIPMLTAMLESGLYPMERMRSSLLAGYEVSGLLDKAFGNTTAGKGLRVAALYGTLGAAAAASRMIGLDVEGTAAALANAAAFTGGTLQAIAEGTDEWRYQFGISARNGLTAALLASVGSISASFAFEGEKGFLSAYVDAEVDADRLIGRLGQDWAIERVVFKPYPVCALNQTPVTAALALRERIGGEAIEAVRVFMNPDETTIPGMDRKGPFGSISETLMSIPFCIAATLIHGAPTMDRMMIYDDTRVNALAAKVALINDARIPTLSTLIELDRASGPIRHEQMMTAADFSYDRQSTLDLVRRIGREQGMAADLYDRLDAFVGNLPNSAIGEVVSLFGVPT
jgi:2-methylcitrate dehydratase PrpD